MLRERAEQCLRWSPCVALEESESPEALLLDIAGCSHLWGDEQALAQDLLEDCRRRREQVTIAIADTVGAALARARHRLAATRQPIAIIPPGRQEKALRPMPVELLRLPAEVLRKLHRLDLHRIGQVCALPRSTLPARFGRVLLDRIDQALGMRPEILTPVIPPRPIDVDWTLEYPTHDRTAIEQIVSQLLEQATAELRAQSRQTQHIALRLHPAQRNQPPTEVHIELIRPTDSSKHLEELVSLQLERLAFSGEIARCEVQMQPVSPGKLRQRTLFDEDGVAERWQHVTQLLDRLTSRLGRDAVLQAFLRSEWLPEAAVGYSPCALSAPPGSASPGMEPTQPLATGPFRMFPLRLFHPPLAIEVRGSAPKITALFWQGEWHRVQRCRGPHRIDTGWWRLTETAPAGTRQDDTPPSSSSGAQRRDYYWLRTSTGRDFWIFLDRERQTWSLQGATLSSPCVSAG